MMMFGLKADTIQAIQGVLAAHPEVEKAILYGSRAMGHYRPGSDIDLTLTGEKLNLTILQKIENELDDLLLPYHFDLSLHRQIQHAGLLEHIERVGIVFYPSHEAHNQLLGLENSIQLKGGMSEWKEVRLGDLIDVRHGFAFKGSYISDEETDKILVTPGNFYIGGGFKHTKFKYYKSDEFPQEYILKSNDVIVTMTDLSKDSDTLGYSAKIPKSDRIKFLHNQRIGLVQFLSDDVDKDFLYWLLRTRDYQGYIVGSASGTSIMHTSPSRIRDYRFFLPSLQEQKAVASILSNLDDKIDLLHRQNATLEKMAETLFRQWFVEEAKEEWEEGSLYDAITLIGGGTPKTDVSEYWNGTIKWLSGGDIASSHKGFVTNVEKSITELGLQNSSAKLLPAYATVISARGTVGKYCLLSEPMAFSQSNYGILPKFDNCYFFTYLLIALSVDELQAAAYGSVFDTITTTTFKEHNIKLPSQREIEQFENSISPYFQKIRSNTLQIYTLARLRDSLLPKLMTGEVKVVI